MATGREARAERLNDRLRGAQRTNVGDESFNLDIGDIRASSSVPPSTSPQQASSPPKRRRTVRDNEPEPAPAARPPPRRSPRKHDGAPDGQAITARRSVGEANPPLRRARSSTPADAVAATEPDELESLPGAPSSSAPSRARHMVEEIGESPENAPGSGRRTNVRAGSALASSARLQATLGEGAAMSSSPLMRKSRASEGSASARSVRQTPEAQVPPTDEVDQVDELSPAGPPPPDSPEEPEEPEPEPEEPEEEEEEEEEEETEAARTLGMKRPRTAPSPQLGEEEEEEEEEEMPEQPRKKNKPSPATQRQGRPKTAAKAPVPAPRPQPRAPPSPPPRIRPAPRQVSVETGSGSDGGEGDSIDSSSGTAIALTVQRFVHHRARDADSDDELQLDMPFANRTQETAVDVFAQVCDEVIAHTLEQFEEALGRATDPARKKELRAKAKAVESYREVVGSRLLQHAIHLNHWHTLRKRVRHAQKEKLALREEILRLKGEREQVALRMDAVREKHEADTKDANFLLNTSTTMRDIDMAVSQGKQAPDLSERQQKEAELANLELAVSQVADQVSSSSPNGGLLSQLKEFNAFLERAAGVLESR